MTCSVACYVVGLELQRDQCLESEYFSVLKKIIDELLNEFWVY